MKRTALCTVKYCPAPTDPWWHECMVCGTPAIEHHHSQGRGGMGGSKRLREDSSQVVPLCRAHHEEVHGLAQSVGASECRCYYDKDGFRMPHPNCPTHKPIEQPSGVESG